MPPRTPHMVSIVVRDNLGNSTTIISTADATSSVPTPIPASIGSRQAPPSSPPQVGSSDCHAPAPWRELHVDYLKVTAISIRRNCRQRQRRLFLVIRTP